MDSNKFDIIVIGGGHAGIEASVASAKMGAKTALITMNTASIAKPSCNPSIGGSAKGHLVKEIDAIGGVMGLLADRAGIQFKMLNKSKGPAIWSPRAQIDKDLYPQYAVELLRNTQNLTLISGSVVKLIVSKENVQGVILDDSTEIKSNAVILCAGTFLNGVMYTGQIKTKGGRLGEPQSIGLASFIKSFGLESGRLKTGTPPRVSGDSLTVEKMNICPGDDKPEPFSFRTDTVENQIMCYMTSSNQSTHDILRSGFERSPMYTGLINGTGPRYCPSIEDKISRFSDRDSHRILLEPEGLSTDSVYVNGFSTSLPIDIQIKGLRSISGMENAELLKPGYAVEYDFFYPYQLTYTLETKAINGLYFAGQINGTSGYEEAASQGLIAGINAVLKLREEQPFILNRSESYIGVLIDDLVNKSTEEPYRVFTSLAEYRLLLRQDNADQRLMKYGNKFGLIPGDIYNSIVEKYNLIERCEEIAKRTKLKPDVVNPYFESIGENNIIQSTDINTLTKRSKVKLGKLLDLCLDLPDEIKRLMKNDKLICQLQTEIKYEGYIKRQKNDIEYFLNNESKLIPKDFDYSNLNSISNEAREKLGKIRPASLGQASRISGVSAADVSVITLFLK